MDIIKMKIKDIIPYEHNPRKNEQAVDAVAESIRQCGYVAPIIVDENNVILAGHTRRLALIKLGKEEAEVVVRDGLTDEQKRKYRLLDNKTNEFASWDFDLLADEIEGLDFGDFDFGFSMETEDNDSYVDDFFDRGVEAKEKPVVLGVKVICGTKEQVDEVMAMLKEAGYSPEEL